MTNPSTILRLSGVQKRFGERRSRFRAPHPGTIAVDGVSLSVREGETLALVGESGCGKSTLARLTMRLQDVDAGRIFYGEREITQLPYGQMRELRSHVQMVFQDPFSSLNPKLSLSELVSEPVRIRERRSMAAGDIDKLFNQVGLDPRMKDRKIRNLSGGQRQRVGIARALSLRPQVLILDEPVSALDASVQAQVLNLLDDLQKELGLAYLFIAHDLGVVSHVADRIAVMYMGRIVEEGSSSDVIGQPEHPYTQALVASIPVDHPSHRSDDRFLLEGEISSAMGRPDGCRFRPRCYAATSVCATDDPQLEPRQAGGGQLACHHPTPVPLAALRKR